LSLSYTEWASPISTAKPPIVLLHGLTSRGDHWESVAGRLAQHRRVIALDARGHGDSDWAKDAAYAVDAHFADVVTALEALAIERCVLVGFSMGGSVAILTAGALSERVERLVVVDSYPAPEMTPGSRRIAERLAQAHLDGALDGAQDAWRRSGRRFDPAIARRMAEELAKGDALRADLWSLWEAVRCPVLLIRGDLSTVLPADLAEEMVVRQPLARLVTIPDVGHPIPFARPAELAVLIEGFLHGRP
jgi:pimeloyl-ACP methyl ester carboxylesterase